MKLLPDNVTSCKKTSEFDEISVPKGLLKSHCTKAGVWRKSLHIRRAVKIYDYRAEGRSSHTK
ncbi:MAG: DUF1971 domain-containing protein [Gammaproteobacteria bacterium]|nr:DUF1971 domain-containing protein [Gammaproteobacteria bacterium]